MLWWNNVTIFAGTKIYEQTVINIVRIHSGSVIGADGFGFAPNPDGP
jgi:UDP-3-O-[3-hydroxymyristoyl] glucosamine N-acyltransferase